MPRPINLADQIASKDAEIPSPGDRVFAGLQHFRRGSGADPMEVEVISAGQLRGEGIYGPAVVHALRVRTPAGATADLWLQHAYACAEDAALTFNDPPRLDRVVRLPRTS